MKFADFGDHVCGVKMRGRRRPRRERSTSAWRGTTEEGTGTYVIPEVGKYYAQAASFFQNGIIGVPGTTPLHYPGAYHIGKHSVVYGIGTDSVKFTGTLTLGPYVWDFGDSSELSLTWPEGPGVAVPVNPADYGNYGGEAKHTYDYHGRFGVNVRVGRNLSGDFEYDYREVHTYDEVWPATTVLGNFPNGVWNQSCPSAARYRLAPICLDLEWNITYYYEADATAWVGDQPPPPADQMTAADCGSISASDYYDSDGGSSSTEDSGSADCAYGSWYYTGQNYNVRRAWSSYDECQDSNDNITGLARIHVVDGCSGCDSLNWERQANWCLGRRWKSSAAKEQALPCRSASRARVTARWRVKRR